MAYLIDTSRALNGASWSERLTQRPASLSTRLANYRTYRATLAELSALSDRDLDDVGLSRGMIRDVAAAAAYQETHSRTQ
jgi:uncharacterized protein YjiS (DUF1127 family)